MGKRRLYIFLHQHKGDEAQEKGIGGLLLETVGMSFGNHLVARYICLLYTSPSPRD